MLRLAMIIWLLLSCPALAGAWPRGKGNVFVASSTYVLPSGAYTGLYAEWGVTERLTLGLDLGRGVSGQDKAVAFVQAPLIRPVAGHHFAWQIGAGVIAGDTVIRPGLSWGKGIDWAGRSGWAALDAVAEVRTETLAIDYKADLTLGLTLSDARKIMLQLQTGEQHGDDPFLRVVPSVTFALSRRARLEIGLSQSLQGARETGLKAAIWVAF
ncbi:hypothetical protein [Lacimonas salitolerans]|uniref:MetA-pathway of phenol degradation n=1 Tax=Lacimonas salitolerans TaxID=1323750 RepID=A0ABW4EMX8_9RHOB